MPVPVAAVGVIPVAVFVLAARSLVGVGVIVHAGVDVLVHVRVLVRMGVGVRMGMDEIAVAVLVGVPVSMLVSVPVLVRMGVRLAMGVTVSGIDRLVVHGILPLRRAGRTRLSRRTGTGPIAPHHADDLRLGAPSPRRSHRPAYALIGRAPARSPIAPPLHPPRPSS
jgi:hypothetical protein